MGLDVIRGKKPVVKVITAESITEALKYIREQQPYPPLFAIPHKAHPLWFESFFARKPTPIFSTTWAPASACSTR